MNILRFIVPLLIAPLPLTASSDFLYPKDTWIFVSPEKHGYDSAKLRQTSDYIQSQMSTTAMIAVVGGEVIFQYGDLKHVSYIASCRKSVLAMLYGNYVASGKIQLTKTVGDLKFDDIGGLLPIEKTATVEHLITARSGVYHPSGDPMRNPPSRGSMQPGEHFQYNNWDFNAAGAAFEKMTRIDIYDALYRDIVKPIQMEDFNRSIQKKSGSVGISVFPCYHMHFSTRDMARIGYLMLRNGAWDGKQLIPKTWVSKITTIVTPPGETESSNSGYGYMWWIGAGTRDNGPYKGMYWAQGSAGQWITVLPAIDMVVAHKTDPEGGKSTSSNDYYRVLDMLVTAKLVR